MRRALAALLLPLLLVACGGDDDEGASLTVFAAASLTEAFTELGAAYEATRPGVDVTFSFAGSQALVAQVGQGAPADVLATADEPSIGAVAGELAQPARVFARNRLAIVTEQGNPLGITGLVDLPRAKVVLAGPAVPVGKAARAALDAVGVAVAPVSQEQDVKAVLSKVRLGEADAGIVYVTDVAAAGDAVTGIGLPGSSNAYPIGVLAGAGGEASGFVGFVLSPTGQAVLARRGFAPP